MMAWDIQRNGWWTSWGEFIPKEWVAGRPSSGGIGMSDYAHLGITESAWFDLGKMTVVIGMTKDWRFAFRGVYGEVESE